MRSLLSVIGSLPGYVIYFGAFLLTAALIAVLLRLIRKKHRKVLIFATLLHFLLGFFFLTVLLDYSYNCLLEALHTEVIPFVGKMLSLPWLLYFLLELASAAVILRYERIFRRYRDTQLTADSIRETVDLLPTGLAVSEADGTVLLANLKIAQLCRSLTGELLSDAGRFWQQIEKEAFRDHLIHTPEGETWQFAKSTIKLGGTEYDQITASDMTEQYRITEELAAKNQHLKEVQFRMKNVAAKERSLVAAREVMNARMTVHNRMGAVLLSGKYYLDHPENVKEEELLRLLEYGNYFLLREAEEPENKNDSRRKAEKPENRTDPLREAETDPLREAIQSARRIGVTTEITGKIPENKDICSLIAQAVDQCAANTVRHAGGDLLFICIEEDENHAAAAFSNNGKVPDGPVTETGGLASLRKAVEEAGGEMTVQSAPAFLLTITVPK